jgi:hypothetical protein
MDCHSGAKGAIHLNRIHMEGLTFGIGLDQAFMMSRNFGFSAPELDFHFNMHLLFFIRSIVLKRSFFLQNSLTEVMCLYQHVHSAKTLLAVS